MNSKRCWDCGETKCLSEFNNMTSAPDGKQKQCRECKAAYSRAYKQHMQKTLDRYKTKKGCASCGYNENPLALQFDHIDRSTKSGNVMWMIAQGKKKVKEEMAKCQVLCANCHAIKTSTEARNGQQ